ncbi:WSC and DUF1996 domain containing protein [Pseudohyphozyma bogoriensis]|nr:WSC and DUF1996 domain containing protein [Pseudohyphozyma bogoriensis]
MRTSFLAASGLLLASTAQAFWRLPCAQPVIVERADPIVSPGKVSGHVHTISGGSNVGLTDTFAEMQASDCTSCLVKQDLSAYWTPALYFQWANGSFSLVDQVGGGLIYYLPRNNTLDTTPVLAFPDGLRVLTGNPFLRSYNESSLQAQAIGWNCLGQASNPTRNPFLPPNDCPDGLRGEVRFPSCWNGVDLDSSDHFSHMAYPYENEDGPCPDTHPVRLVTLFYEMMWSVNPWVDLRSQGLNTTQPFVLAMGDPTGYGYHGDFLDGWNKTVLQEAIDTCTSDSGVIEYCEVFDLYDSDHTCHKTPDVDEIVDGTLDTLPGCNPVTWGPETANPAPVCPNYVAPSLFTSPVAYTGEAPPPGSEVLSNAPSVVESYEDWNYVSCYSDAASVRALPNGLTNSPGTVEGCLDACASKGYALCGIEYYGECWGGNTLASTSTDIGYGQCGYACKGNGTQYCGGSNAFDLYTRNSTTVVTSSSTTSTQVSTSTSVAASVTTTTTATSTSSSASPSSTALVGKVTTNPAWTYSNCMADLVNSARSLPYTLTNDGTASGCLDECAAAGYAVCGLSYHGECYGGAALSSASTVLAASKCAMTCTNDASETCGGSAALDVYLSTTVAPLTYPSSPNGAVSTKWEYDACYSDLVGGARSLPLGLTSNSTVDGCLAACTNANATVCGLSYYGECWASTDGLASSSSLLNDTSCSYPCKNNPLEWCGGSAALSVYVPKTIAGKVYTNSRWSYDTCMSDLVNGGRSLPNTLSNDGTVDGCLAACDAAGYAVCGLSYYGECYGGSAISRASTEVDASKCDFKCTNAPTETCGGSGTLDVYISTVVPSVTTPATSNVNTSDWTFSGCQSDLVNNVRSLPTGLSTNGTVEGCLAACTEAGSVACGLSYYGECWSSTTGISNASTVLPATSCEYACKGNPLEWCGGSSALSYYVPSASVVLEEELASRLKARFTSRLREAIASRHVRMRRHRK